MNEESSNIKQNTHYRHERETCAFLNLMTIDVNVATGIQILCQVTQVSFDVIYLNVQHKHDISQSAKLWCFASQKTCRRQG